MTRLMKNTALFGALALATACGGGERLEATLEAPAPREARITITPALDISGLAGTSVSERLAVDDIALNLADVRLLGADPRIPAGGLPLLRQARVISANGDQMVGIELPFPEYLLAQDDLAVYVRLDRSDVLGGASVVVHARVYEHPVSGVSPLTSNPDPDGDPAEPTGATNPDPDGDPASCASLPAKGNPMNPDPDGDPASPRCVRRFALTERGEVKSVAIELRGEDTADLMAQLSSRSSLDVVVGIPAAHWLTSDAVAALDQALQAQQPAQQPKSGEMVGKDTAKPDDTIIVKAAEAREQEPGSEAKADRGRDDYFLTDDLGSGSLRR